MNFNELEKALKTKPAKIYSEVDETGMSKTQFEGRGIELISLSMNIVEGILKRMHMSVDEYFELFKEATDIDEKQKKQDEVEKMLNNIIGDIFK